MYGYNCSSNIIIIIVYSPAVVHHLLFNRFFQLPLSARKYLVKPFGGSAGESRAEKIEPRTSGKDPRAAKFPSDRLLNIGANGRRRSVQRLPAPFAALLRPPKSSPRWYSSVPTNTMSSPSNRLSKLSYVHALLSAAPSCCPSFRLFRRTDGNFRMNPNAADFLSSGHGRWSGCCNTRLPGGSGGCAHKPDMADTRSDLLKRRSKRNIGTSAVWLVNYINVCVCVRVLELYINNTLTKYKNRTR